MRALRSWSHARTIVVVLIPVVLGVLELGHPRVMPGGSVYETIAPITRFWTTLHVVQLPLLALLGGCALLLTINARGPAVTVARIALVVFTVVYPAYDAVVGIASGIVVNAAGHLTADTQNAFETSLESLFWGPVTTGIYIVAAASWLIGIVATAIVVQQQGAHWSAVILLLASALSFAIAHFTPFGPMACFFFAIAAAIVQLTARQSFQVTIRRRPIIHKH